MPAHPSHTISAVSLVDLEEFDPDEAPGSSKFGERLHAALVEFGFVRVCGHGKRMGSVRGAAGGGR